MEQHSGGLHSGFNTQHRPAAAAGLSLDAILPSWLDAQSLDRQPADSFLQDPFTLGTDGWGLLVSPRQESAVAGCVCVCVCERERERERERTTSAWLAQAMLHAQGASRTNS